jgi:hypothetical protein
VAQGEGPEFKLQYRKKKIFFKNTPGTGLDFGQGHLEAVESSCGARLDARVPGLRPLNAGTLCFCHKQNPSAMVSPAQRIPESSKQRKPVISGMN